MAVQTTSGGIKAQVAPSKERSALAGTRTRGSRQTTALVVRREVGMTARLLRSSTPVDLRENSGLNIAVTPTSPTFTGPNAV
jgi:hypothetical protein